MAKKTALLIVAILGLAGFSYGAVTPLLNYQGRLTNSAGAPLTGNYTILFSIYNVSTGGSALWSETQSVSASEGLFSVVLGITTGGLNLPFDADYWLGIKIGSDSEMTPRQRLTPAGYAIRAGTAAYVVNAANSVGKYGDVTTLNGNVKLEEGTNVTITRVGANNSLKIDAAGSGSQWTTFGSNIYYNTGNVGIGTTAPNQRMTVAGNISQTGIVISSGTGNNYFAGNIGVGTTGPGSILDINGALTARGMSGPALSPAGQGRIYFDSVSNVFKVSEDGSAYVNLAGGGGNIIDTLAATLGAGNDAGGRNMVNLGNVGIGTTSPAYRLVVSSSAGESGNLVVISTGASNIIRMTGAGEIYANKYYGDGSMLTGIVGALSGGQTPLLSYWTGSNTLGSSNLSRDSATSLTAVGSTFTVQGNAFSVGVSMLVVNSGDVGIGTANPSNKLHIEGTGGGSAGIYLNSAVPSATSYTLYNNAGTLTWNGTPLATGSSVSGTTGRISKFTSSSALGDSAIFENTGNVGIGTTGPTHKLRVEGGILATSSITAQGGFYGDGATLTGLTKTQVGLGSADNTADTAKPVSSAQQNALDLKANLASPTFTGTVGGITKTMVGLGSVDNTADTAKPVSTAQQTALDAKAVAATVATDTTTLKTQIDLKANLASPTFTGTVSGITKTMVGLGSVDNTADTAKPVSTAQQTALDAKAVAATVATDTTTLKTQIDLKAPLASPTFTGTVGGITKTMVGLGSVDNTADTTKPVSTAQQTALDLKAPLASPTFTGTVGGITKTMVGLGSVDNTADTAKPVSTAQQTALDLKAPLASPTFTGTVGGITKTMVGLGSVDNTADTAKPVSTAQQTALDLKAADNAVVKLTGAQSIAGVKTFSDNVGIGASPSNKLHVEGTGGGAAGIYLNNAVPSATSSTLYNNAGTLYWDGSAVGGGGSQTPWTSNINAAGYTLYGNNTASGNLSLESTSNATKGYVLLNPNGGNVGIGTASPTGKIHVSTGTGATSLFVSGSGSTAGYIGIGTTGPGQKLEVYGSGGSPATSGSTQNGLFRVRSSVVGGLDIGVLSGSPFSTWLQAGSKTDLSTNYRLALNPNGGYVGIGTTSPSAPLHLGGSENQIMLNDSSSLNFFSSGGDHMSIVYYSGAAQIRSEYWNTGTSMANPRPIKIKGSTLSLITASQTSDIDATPTRLLINENGDVGIGTTNPNVKLHISSSTLMLDGTGAPATGGALCLNASKQMSKCTSAIDASGNCTCP